MEQDIMPGTHTEPMFLEDTKSEIEQFLLDYSAAVRRGRIEEILAFYAKDVVAFDMMPPLTINGVEEYKICWEKCFTNYFSFPVQYSFSEVSIVANQDLAVCHCLATMSGANKSGGKMDVTLRSTFCLQVLDGAWVITHEHNSVPSDKNGKALMNLKTFTVS